MAKIIALACSTGLITPRSKFPGAAHLQFTVMTKTPNGVWVDVMSSDNQHMAESHASYHARTYGQDCVILDNTK